MEGPPASVISFFPSSRFCIILLSWRLRGSIAIWIPAEAAQASIIRRASAICPNALS